MSRRKSVWPLPFSNLCPITCSRLNWLTIFYKAHHFAARKKQSMFNTANDLVAKDVVQMIPQEQEAMSSSILVISSQMVHTPIENNTSKDVVKHSQLCNFFSDTESLPEASDSQNVSSTDENGSNEELRKRRITISTTELRASKSPNLSSYTIKEDFNPPFQVTPVGIDWYQPSYMLGLFIVGLVGMICHHVYNSHMDGKIVVQLQWPQRFGSTFSFFAKMCMVGAVNIAYKQVVWVSNGTPSWTEAFRLTSWSYVSEGITIRSKLLTEYFL